MARKTTITEEEKEFIREVFEWIQTTGVEKGYFSRNWKEDLIEYIQDRLWKEGKKVKKESVRRNLNRMIAYYYETGAQARSGRVYLKYIKEIFDRFNEEIRLVGGEVAQYFLTTEEARLYRGEITALHDIPDFWTKTIVMYRYYPESRAMEVLS